MIFKVKTLIYALFTCFSTASLSTGCSCSTPPGHNFSTNTKSLSSVLKSAFVQKQKNFDKKRFVYTGISAIFMSGYAPKEKPKSKETEQQQINQALLRISGNKNAQGEGDTWLFDNKNQYNSLTDFQKNEYYVVEMFVTTSGNQDWSKPNKVIINFFQWNADDLKSLNDFIKVLKPLANYTAGGLPSTLWADHFVNYDKTNWPLPKKK